MPPDQKEFQIWSIWLFILPVIMTGVSRCVERYAITAELGVPVRYVSADEPTLREPDWINESRSTARGQELVFLCCAWLEPVIAPPMRVYLTLSMSRRCNPFAKSQGDWPREIVDRNAVRRGNRPRLATSCDAQAVAEPDCRLLVPYCVRHVQVAAQLNPDASPVR